MPRPTDTGGAGDYAEAALASSSPLILLIEDEDVLRLTFKQLLEDEGFSVVTAADGEEGVARCRAQSPHLVITDLFMPVQDGYRTIEILHQEFPTLPVIAMSAIMGPKARERSLEVGASCCVTKPIDFTALLNVVHNVLSA